MDEESAAGIKSTPPQEDEVVAQSSDNSFNVTNEEHPVAHQPIVREATVSQMMRL